MHQRRNVPNTVQRLNSTAGKAGELGRTHLHAGHQPQHLLRDCPGGHAPDRLPRGRPAAARDLCVKSCFSVRQQASLHEWCLKALRCRHLAKALWQPCAFAYPT